jgi:hypothetical protein
MSAGGAKNRRRGRSHLGPRPVLKLDGDGDQQETRTGNRGRAAGRATIRCACCRRRSTGAAASSKRIGASGMAPHHQRHEHEEDGGRHRTKALSQAGRDLLQPIFARFNPPR